MKKLLTLIFVFLVVISSSCKKESSDLQEAYLLEQVPGTWQVSSFIADNVEITNQFAGFTFDCKVNGEMNIRNYSHAYNCRWSFIEDNHARVHFSTTDCDVNSVLKEFDDDWFITSRDANYCHFSNHNIRHPRTMTLHRG